MSPSRGWRVLLVAVVGAAVVPALGAGASPAPAADAPIRLQAATFHPTRGEVPELPPGLTIAGYAPGRPGYYIVQFAGPVLPEWKHQVEQLGAELLDYLPDFAFKTRMTSEQAAAVESQASVSWVGLFHPAYKISPRAAGAASGLFRVRLERGSDVAATVAAIAQAGALPIRREGRVVLVAASPGQVGAMARVLDVAWIEPFAFPEKHNEQAGGVILGGSIALGRGFDGSTQIVAVADTGLGDGTAAGAHPDIPDSRIVAIYDWPGANYPPCYKSEPDGPQDVDSGHGTHTAVSAVGDGGTGGVGRGTAPAAGLVFQAIEDFADVHFLCLPPDGYYLLGLPMDLHDLYQQAYDDLARIHSNSWGVDDDGVYSIDSANTDDFVFDHPNFTVTFSAGNAGEDLNPADGVVDPGSVGSPATAKNVIAVGASEGDRPDGWPCDTGLGYSSHDLLYQSGTCADQGGLNTLGTAGARWGFTEPPLDTDVTAGDAEQMAPFSSRGPTLDGRIKPDLVAPGTWILSGYSSQYQEGYGGTVNPENLLYQWDGWGIPYDQDYKYMGGTSMSNPLAAGAAAVVADFYVKTAAHTASAALVKATLINSARDLLDENNDGVDDNDFPIPNEHEGWGIIDLDEATDDSHNYVDNATGIGTSGSAVFEYEVAAGGSPLKISLVWSDAPSTEAASANLVNDLDLVVVAPSGTTTYVGNDFTGGWSQPSTNYDRVNNVENVYVASATTGVWTVTVLGYNVPAGPQPFALVVDGDLVAGLDTIPPVIIGVPDDITAEATGPGGATVTYSNPTAIDLVDGPVPVECVPASGSVFPLGVTTVSCSATDSSDNTATEQFDVTVQDTTAPVISNVPDDIVVAATGPSGATVDYTPPTASDLVDGPVAVECTLASGSLFPIGVTTVSCTATDTSDNTATEQFDVTVQDTSAPDDVPPVISGVPDDIAAEAAGPSGATVSYSLPTASDLVDGSVPVECAPASGLLFPMGVTTVSCTATDNSDNTATEEFDVTVQDTTAPVMSGVPDDIIAEATGPGGVTVTYSNPTATDLVDGSLPVGCVPASGFLFPIAATTVSCSATDNSDNTATEEFDVTVQDTTAPVISNVPADIITVASEPAGARPSYQLPTATDTVDGLVAVGCVPASGSLFPMGVTMVSCSATDTSDNTATGQFDVTVVPPLCRGRVATIWGSAGDDVLQGTPGTDVIVGFAGADLIDGRGGNDFICGGKGADEIRGGGGTDRIWGNAGHDTLRGGKGSDKLFGNGGNDALFGQAGRKDRLVGGGGVDSLDGGPGSADFCDGEIMVDCELGPS